MNKELIIYSLGVIVANTEFENEEVLSSVDLILSELDIEKDHEELIKAYMNSFEDISYDQAVKEISEKLDIFV